MTDDSLRSLCTQCHTDRSTITRLRRGAAREARDASSLQARYDSGRTLNAGIADRAWQAAKRLKAKARMVEERLTQHRAETHGVATSLPADP